jgi:hypothetical protein
MGPRRGRKPLSFVAFWSWSPLWWGGGGPPPPPPPPTRPPPGHASSADCNRVPRRPPPGDPTRPHGHRGQHTANMQSGDPSGAGIWNDGTMELVDVVLPQTRAPPTGPAGRSHPGGHGRPAYAGLGGKRQHGRGHPVPGGACHPHQQHGQRQHDTLACPRHLGGQRAADPDQFHRHRQPAGVQGGGIMASGDATPGVSVTLSNRIVVGHSAPADGDCAQVNGSRLIVTDRYKLLGEGSGCPVGRAPRCDGIRRGRRTGPVGRQRRARPVPCPGGRDQPGPRRG